MVSVGDVRVARIDKESFIELVLATRPVFDRLMATVRPVVSKAAQREANRERLAALGTMAAGLAHELNNPAAAAKRAAADLAETLVTFEEFVGKLVEAGVERGEAAKVVHLKDELLERARVRGEERAGGGRRRGRAARPAGGARRRQRLESRRPARRCLRRRRLADAHRGGRRRRPERGDLVGRRLAAGAHARRRAGRVDRSHVRARQSGQVVRLHGSRRGRPGRRPRGHRDDADGAEAQRKHRSIDLDKSFDKTLPRITMYGSSRTRSGRT